MSGETDPADKILTYPRLLDWKHNFWKEVSKDAKNRGAFPAEDFDEAGLIRSYIKSYHRLFDWLSKLENVTPFDNMTPLWVYKGNGEWELYLVDIQDWIHCKKIAERWAMEVKPAPLQSIGKFAGLTPDNGIGVNYNLVNDLGDAAKSGESSKGAPISEGQILPR